MGLMSRILSKTGAVAGDGLLKRALELRLAAQKKVGDPVLIGALPTRPVDPAEADAEKKKPLQRFSKRAA
ncbi:MAG: hypothetical protein KOO61_07505 [Spirochaetales bacterium]|nr:hypothetical protein [Spirochaetales bacterium]